MPIVADLIEDYDLLKEKFLAKKQHDADLFKGNENSLNDTNEAVKRLNSNVYLLQADVNYVKRIFN